MKKISRRKFLKNSIYTGASACCLAAFGGGRASQAYASDTGNGNTVVLLNQFGGNDGLNSFSIPYTVGAYYDRRPTIAIPTPQVLPTGAGTGFHPSLVNIHQLFLDGDVAVIQGTGDPQNTRSHFTAQDNISRGLVGSTALDSRGWVGRLGDLYMSDISFNTFGIGAGNRVDFVSTRDENRPIVTGSLSSMGFNRIENGRVNFNSRVDDRLFRLITQRAMLEGDKEVNQVAKSLRLSQRDSHNSAAIVQDVVANYTGPGGYENTSTGRYLSDVARLMESELCTRVTFGGVGGWDNHSNQTDPNVQQRRLEEIDNAVGLFADDIKRSAVNDWNNVAICIYTEFGRNTFENSSAGTDHGWGGTMLVIGGAVRGGVYGSTPTDNELRNEGSVIMDVDFRNVFAELVTWLGYNPNPVFPEDYNRVSLSVL